MPTHYRGTQEEVRSLNAYINLMRAASSLTARLQAGLEASGLTSSQFSVLEALYHLGPLCQKDIGQKLLRTSGNITFILDNLAKLKYIRRVREGEDRRFVRIELTDAGLKAIRSALPLHVEAVAKELGVLSEQEQEELRRLCRKLGKAQKEEQ